jgi:3-oxoacyl-(acyl-carrier-protein) synthase
MDRIVITGYGVKVPGGKNVSEFKQTLETGFCALETVNDLTPKGQPLTIGAIHDEIEELSDKQYRYLPRISKLAIGSAIEAVKMSKIKEFDSNRTGVFYGTGLGGTLGYEETISDNGRKSFSELPIYICGLVNYHSLASSISSYFNLHGITKTLSTGCTSSMESLQDAIMYIKSNQIDVAIVGGSDSANCKTTVYGFGKFKTIPINKSIEESGIAFSKHSKGFVLAEGAGTLIVERESHALKRGATIYGVIDEIFSNNDSATINGADPEGKLMMECLSQVLKGRIPDYVNSQALGLQANDIVERNISKQLFSHNVPYTSIKSMIGHALGASGIIQVISSLISFTDNFISGTIRTDKAGFEEVNLIQNTYYQNVNEIAITTHGYGGNNACTYLLKN